jgi:integrase
MARRDLEELRAAINHHRQEGLHDRIVSVVLPSRRPPRERWLDRGEVAKLLWTAWRRPKCKQLARFILFALYTGRRSTVVCDASFRRERLAAHGLTLTVAAYGRRSEQREPRNAIHHRASLNDCCRTCGAGAIRGTATLLNGAMAR